MKRKACLTLLCGVMLFCLTGCAEIFVPIVEEKSESSEMKLAEPLQEIEDEITNMEDVETAKVIDYGESIYISVTYVDNISSEHMKNEGVKILSLFDQDIIDNKEFKFEMISMGYASCSAYKNYDEDDINWDCYDLD